MCMEEKILTDTSEVKGQIYLIENTLQNKKYVGQTVSHRKNHNKYRPFGFQGRFNDHVSEAICNTKKKQCRYLNNAIRAYGKDFFKVSLLHTCPKEELDMWEKHYIQAENTLFPNGYNLTKGGKTFDKEEYSEKTTPLTPSKRGGCESRNEDTREKISERLKEYYDDADHSKNRMLLTQKQHDSHKIEIFKDEKLDTNNLEKYIHIHKSRVRVVINKKRVEFVGKHQTMEELHQRAIDFLQKLAATATLSNCSGNP